MPATAASPRHEPQAIGDRRPCHRRFRALDPFEACRGGISLTDRGRRPHRRSPRPSRTLLRHKGRSFDEAFLTFHDLRRATEGAVTVESHFLRPSRTRRLDSEKRDVALVPPSGPTLHAAAFASNEDIEQSMGAVFPERELVGGGAASCGCRWPLAPEWQAIDEAAGAAPLLCGQGPCVAHPQIDRVARHIEVARRWPEDRGCIASRTRAARSHPSPYATCPFGLRVVPHPRHDVGFARVGDPLER